MCWYNWSKVLPTDIYDLTASTITNHESCENENDGEISSQLVEQVLMYHTMVRQI